jgi:hypothetical protein
LNSLPNEGYDYQPIQSIVREPSFPYGKAYVSLLARQGKIDAYKEGKNWYTSKEAIENYIDNRQRIRKFE